MTNDLVIPIYVDTNALLDVLASIEGGFSVVEKVTTREANATGINRAVKADTGTEFGVPNVLSLLKLTLGYSADWKKEKEEHHEKEAERYHTYGSLFYRLREYLDENALVKRPDDGKTAWETVSSSEFVEVRGIFRPNPFASSLGIIDRLLGMSQLFIGIPAPKAAAIAEKASGAEERRRVQEEKRLVEQAKEQARAQAKQMEDFRKLMQGVLSDIQSEKIRIFVVDLTKPAGYKAVSLLFLDYLRDQTMLEISNKEYRMLGKVVRKIEKGSGEHIDLLSGTGLGGIGKTTLEQLVGAFGQIPGMNLPEIQTEIAGPALEIVPIAVFV